MGYFADFMDDADMPELMCEGSTTKYKDSDGHFLPGTRKCSRCNEYKTTKDFNKEQAKKPASKRICDDCGPPMPSDLNSFTVVQLKEELTKRGESDLSGKKSDLVARLQALLDSSIDKKKCSISEKTIIAHQSAVENSTLTLEKILSFKVVDLKKELKKRALPVSGLKAVLQKRLAGECSLSLDPPTKECAPTKGGPGKKLEDTTNSRNVSVNTNASECKASKAALIKQSPVQDPQENHNEFECKEKDTSAKLEQLNKNTSRIVAHINNENAANGVSKKINWRKFGPNGGSETKVVGHRTFCWCAKCRLWTPTHNTSQHVSKKGKKKNKAAKKAIPLVPHRPGGSFMGLPCATGPNNAF